MEFVPASTGQYCPTNLCIVWMRCLHSLQVGFFCCRVLSSFCSHCFRALVYSEYTLASLWSALVSPGWTQCHVLKCPATGFSFLVFQNVCYFNILMLSIFSYGNTDEYVVFKLLLVSYLKGTLLGLVYDSSLYMQKLYFI